MAQFTLIEELNEGLLTLASQLPPLVRDAINDYISQPNNHRAFRQELFNACSDNYEYTMDQVHAYVLNEYLALGVQLNPPAFNPADHQPSQLAQQKAQSFISTYLMNQYLNGLHQLGHGSALINELTVNAGDLYLAQVERLRFNYNQRFTVGDYLTDLKQRIGLPTEMIIKQAASFGASSTDTLGLLSQLGKGLGVAAYLQDELTLLKEARLADFIKRIISGNYPLVMLFAQREVPEQFQAFFNQPHRPSKGQFADLRDQCYLHGQQAAIGIINDLVKQARLDWQVLPAGTIKDQLDRLISKLETN